MSIDLVTLAQIFAEGAHKGQVRPYTWEPYIAHPARVVGILQQYVPDAPREMIAAAWLHDVLEDTATEAGEIRDAFDDIVETLVIELTKPNQPRTFSARVIKACDLIDNVGTIADVAPRAQARAYMARKAPQILQITEALVPAYPALAEALAQAFWRSWKLASA